MTFFATCRFTESIIAASVVDLPLPTVPQTSTRPRGRLRPHLDVEVRSLELHHLLQHSLDVHPHSPRTVNDIVGPTRKSTPRCRTPPGIASAHTPRAERFRRESGRCAPALRIRFR